MMLTALTLALAFRFSADLVGTVRFATAVLTRQCRDQWAEQSARIICAPRIDFLTAPIPSWW